MTEKTRDGRKIGSGFAQAGRIVSGYDGGNHESHRDIVRCRSCGALLFPEDQRIHEDSHTNMDRLLCAAGIESEHSGTFDNKDEYL
jgi:hypothetical protein